MRCHRSLAACDNSIAPDLFMSSWPTCFKCILSSMWTMHSSTCYFLWFLRKYWFLLELLWPPSWSISCILNETDPLVTLIRLRHTCTLYTKRATAGSQMQQHSESGTYRVKSRRRRVALSEIPWILHLIQLPRCNEETCQQQFFSTFHQILFNLKW